MSENGTGDASAAANGPVKEEEEDEDEEGVSKKSERQKARERQEHELKQQTADAAAASTTKDIKVAVGGKPAATVAAVAAPTPMTTDDVDPLDAYMLEVEKDVSAIERQEAVRFDAQVLSSTLIHTHPHSFSLILTHSCTPSTLNTCTSSTIFLRAQSEKRCQCHWRCDLMHMSSTLILIHALHPHSFMHSIHTHPPYTHALHPQFSHVQKKWKTI